MAGYTKLLVLTDLSEGSCQVASAAHCDVLAARL